MKRKAGFPMELEEIMTQLEQTVDKMENEKLSLEEAYETFSYGMKLVLQGNQAIDKVEKKIEILMQKETEDSEDE
jgi:exodeoxyribonuclease VII small subunit